MHTSSILVQIYRTMDRIKKGKKRGDLTLLASFPIPPAYALLDIWHLIRLQKGAVKKQNTFLHDTIILKITHLFNFLLRKNAL